MALIRFRPFSQALEPSRDLTDIQTHVNRLFDNFLGQPSASGLMERRWAPAVDMYETKNEVVISAELPGISEKDIHLSITGDLLTIQGERHGATRSRMGATTAGSGGSESSSARSRCRCPSRPAK